MPSWPTAASHASSPWAQARDRESGSVHVVDLDEPARRWQWTSELMMPTPLAFSPDGKLLVVAGWQQPKRMELREVTTGRLVLKSDIRMDTPEYQPRTRFADAGRKLVTTTHEASDSLEAVFSVAFSPDSRSLATGAGGREAIKLWHVETGQELLTLPGQGILLSDIAFAEDANTLLLGRFRQPGSWQMWRAPSWAEIAAAEAKDPPMLDLGERRKAKGKQP